MTKEIIYVYTTNTYRNLNWYKIGMTNQESGTIRISQQDGTSNPERLEKQYEMNIFGETDLTAYEVEQKIHRYYDRLGKRVRDNREWFEVSGGIDEIKRVKYPQENIFRFEAFNGTGTGDDLVLGMTNEEKELFILPSFMPIEENDLIKIN